MVDTGLDYSSCFFIDEDGEEVRHGFYFDEIGLPDDFYSATASSSTFSARAVFNGGDFHADINRRKVSFTHPLP